MSSKIEEEVASADRRNADIGNSAVLERVHHRGHRSNLLGVADSLPGSGVQEGLHTVLVDGEEVELAPTNVVVALVSYGVSPADPQTPEPGVFGTGPVQVFTQGREVQGTWSRSEEDGRWDLRSVTGELVPLAPGSTWVLLVSDGSRFATGTISTFSQVDGTRMLDDARTVFAETAAS